MKTSKKYPQILFCVLAITLLSFILSGTATKTSHQTINHEMTAMSGSMMNNHDMTNMSKPSNECQINSCNNQATNCTNHCLFSASSLSILNIALPGSLIFAIVLLGLSITKQISQIQNRQPAYAYCHSNRKRILSTRKIE